MRDRNDKWDVAEARLVTTYELFNGKIRGEASLIIAIIVQAARDEHKGFLNIQNKIFKAYCAGLGFDPDAVIEYIEEVGGSNE